MTCVAEQQPVWKSVIIFYYNFKKHKMIIIRTMISKCKLKLYVNGIDSCGKHFKSMSNCNHSRQHHKIKEEPILKTRQCLREENVLQWSHMIRCWNLTSLHPTVIPFIHSLTNSITVTSETTQREGTRDKRVELEHHRQRIQWNVCLETTMFCQTVTRLSFSPYLCPRLFSLALAALLLYTPKSAVLQTYQRTVPLWGR